MTEQTIIIPDSCKYADPLRVLVDPPSDTMKVSLTLEGEEKPFREGKIENRRCPEIAIYFFRPRKLNKEKKAFDKPLEKGDVVKVEAQVKDKSGEWHREVGDVEVL